MSRKKPVTLLFASTNLEHNNAVAMKEMVDQSQGDRDSPFGRLRYRRKTGNFLQKITKVTKE